MRRTLGFLAGALVVDLVSAFAEQANRWQQFTAFAYSAGVRTSTGSVPRAGITVAADPRVLPMGSRILIAGANEYSGIYTVLDTGPKIKGRAIDVYVASKEAAKRFGRKLVQVKVLHIPSPQEFARGRTLAVKAEVLAK